MSYSVLAPDFIAKLPADRASDSLIAVALFGYQWYSWRGLYVHCGAFLPGEQPVCATLLDKAPDESRLHTARDLPHYTTDVAAAWQVVVALEQTHDLACGLQARYKRAADGPMTRTGWVAKFTPKGVLEGYGEPQADTAPLAICRAALLAVLHPIR